MIVVDASALVDLLLNLEPQADALAERFLRPGETLHAPTIIDAEVFGAVRNRTLRRVISDERGFVAIVELGELGLVRHGLESLLPSMWSLRHAMSAFDSAYVALAEALDAPLVTTDKRLGRATGHDATIEIYP